MREVIIGDIHGYSGSLKALLERLRPNPATDRLILLGDLFDRGPDSWQVLKMVTRLAEMFSDRFVLLRGNHEDYLMNPRLTLYQRIVWEQVGRQATVKSFQQHGEKMESSIPWLEKHCVMYCKGNGFQCVHAGVMVSPIEANSAEVLLHDHDMVRKNVYDGPLTVAGHIALDKPTWFVGDGKTVVDLTEGEIRTLPGKGVICIDTGGGKGGKLTGMVVKDGRYALCSVPES